MYPIPTVRQRAPFRNARSGPHERRRTKGSLTRVYGSQLEPIRRYTLSPGKTRVLRVRLHTRHRDRLDRPSRNDGFSLTSSSANGGRRGSLVRWAASPPPPVRPRRALGDPGPPPGSGLESVARAFPAALTAGRSRAPPS